MTVENYLKKKSGLDAHGFDLATRALSFEVDKQTCAIKRAPLIAINGLKNESERNEQDGIRYMLMGFFQGPRNLYQDNHIGSGVSNTISVIIERPSSFICLTVAASLKTDAGLQKSRLSRDLSKGA